MRTIILGALAALALAGAARAQQTGESLAKAAETCIRGQAPRVVGQSQSLEDAVNFLVDGLCAADIRHFEAYDRSSRLLAAVKPQGKGGDTPAGGAAKALAMLALVTIDPETGDLAAPAGANSIMSTPLTIANWFGGGFASTAAHARFRTLAAQAVLEAREGPGHK